MTEENSGVSNSISPPTINHVVASGENRKIIERIKIAIDAAFMGRRPYPHTLLDGPAGCGKTMLAETIARELAIEPKLILGQTIHGSAASNGLLVGLGAQPAVLIIDEIHTLAAKAQHAFLRAMENGDVFVDLGTGRSVKIKLGPLTVIGCTTDSYLLLQPLRDRFPNIHRLTIYSTEDIETLLRQKVRQQRLDVSDDVYPLIAARSRGVPRLAVNITESVRSVATAEGSDTIRVEHARKSFELDGIDDAGLINLDRNYLQILREISGPVRLNVLAMRLNVREQTLVKNIEPYLVQIGLVTKVSEGRRLTEKGIAYLSDPGGAT